MDFQQNWIYIENIVLKDIVASTKLELLLV